MDETALNRFNIFHRGTYKPGQSKFEISISELAAKMAKEGHRDGKLHKRAERISIKVVKKLLQKAARGDDKPVYRMSLFIAPVLLEGYKVLLMKTLPEGIKFSCTDTWISRKY